MAYPGGQPMSGFPAGLPGTPGMMPMGMVGPPGAPRMPGMPGIPPAPPPPNNNMQGGLPQQQMGQQMGQPMGQPGFANGASGMNNRNAPALSLDSLPSVVRSFH